MQSDAAASPDSSASPVVLVVASLCEGANASVTAAAASERDAAAAAFDL